jgi:hypothetical protein
LQSRQSAQFLSLIDIAGSRRAAAHLLQRNDIGFYRTDHLRDSFKINLPSPPSPWCML